MQEPRNFDKEINSDKRLIFALIIVIVALRLIYTTVGIHQEISTGKKQIQVIPYDAALYSLYLMSKKDTDTLGAESVIP